MIRNYSQPIRPFKLIQDRQAQGEKGFAMPAIIAIVAFVILALGVGYYIAQKQPKELPLQEEKVSAVLAGHSAPLVDYNKADYDAAVKSDKLIVLYFYANWCPICKAEFPVMQSVFNELTSDKVIGFRVNYNDDETDNDEKNLAREFGVVYQHTKVFVKNGERILKSPEGWDDKRYDMEINKALAL